MAAQRFDVAPLDQTGRAVTSFTIGLVLIIPAAVSLVAPSPDVLVGVIVIGALVVAVSWALSPAAYVLDGRQLVVSRRLWWRPFTAVVEGFSRHDEPGRLGIRTAASGGAFGWYGRFRRSDLGTIRAYLTSRDAAHVVALTSDRGVLVLSPEDRKAFTSTMKKALKS